MTRAWRLTGTGLDALVLDERPSLRPGAGEVVVQLQAAAINHRDLGILQGVYPNRPGVIPFSDGAGVVAALGEGVTEFALGDKVISSFYPFWENGPADARNHRASLGCEIDGLLAEHALLPATALVAAPRSLDPSAAATLPCAGLTAWSALFTEGELRAGQTVLIQGTGGVAVFALQLAVRTGARAIVLTSSTAKAERAKSLGADITIDYRQQPQWAEAVIAATNGEGADVVIELGGQDTLPQSMSCVRVGGRICVIGVLSGLVASVPVPSLLFRHIRLVGITVGHRADLAALCRAVDTLGLDPVIDQRFSFEQVPEIYATLPHGKHFGKLIVEMDF